MVDLEHRALKVSAKFDPPSQDLDQVIEVLQSMRESLGGNAKLRINVSPFGKVRNLEATG